MRGPTRREHRICMTSPQHKKKSGNASQPVWQRRIANNRRLVSNRYDTLQNYSFKLGTGHMANTVPLQVNVLYTPKPIKPSFVKEVSQACCGPASGPAIDPCKQNKIKGKSVKKAATFKPDRRERYTHKLLQHFTNT